MKVIFPVSYYDADIFYFDKIIILTDIEEDIYFSIFPRVCYKTLLTCKSNFKGPCTSFLYMFSMEKYQNTS